MYHSKSLTAVINVFLCIWSTFGLQSQEVCDFGYLPDPMTFVGCVGEEDVSLRLPCEVVVVIHLDV